jgi:hypothetical protein
MVRIVIGAFAATLLATAVLAQGAPAPPNEAMAMRDFFAGTLEIDVPSADWSAKRFLAPDHTYRETGSNGDVHGTWVIENGKICATEANPPEDRPARYCNVGVGRKLGEMWKDADPVTGNTVLFNLKPGR